MIQHQKAYEKTQYGVNNSKDIYKTQIRHLYVPRISCSLSKNRRKRESTFCF